ncbi:MAG TPA: 30S ribosomal protein S18 [Spirochaetia bacterium]|nr:30S ribosomal protein S18 [Spirochaetia bacterium]
MDEQNNDDVEQNRNEDGGTGRSAPPDRPDRGDRGYGGRSSDDRGEGRGDGRGGYRGGKGKTFFRRKVCKFCTQKVVADYKNPDGLRRFVTERGKILPRRITGTCAKHQRLLAREIKRARALAFLPFAKR